MGINGSSNDLLSDHSLLEAVIIEMFFFFLIDFAGDELHTAWVYKPVLYSREERFLFAKIVPKSTKLVNL